LGGSQSRLEHDSEGERSEGMRYDVGLSDGSRFEHEQDEPLKVGDSIGTMSMVYQVTRVTPLAADESGEFDAVVDAKWMAGPAQGAGHRP
jgi:hypothetical protein